MRFTFRTLSVLLINLNVMRWGVNSSHSFNYERMHMFGLGQRVIPSISHVLKNRESFPEPLPPRPKPKIPPIPTPYHSLYQGARKANDKRVFRRRFKIDSKSIGQQVFFDGMFECLITYLAVETDGCIPIILRGGVGYRYFNVVVKSKPNVDLTGQVRAFCQKTELDYYKERQTKNLVKVYIFPETTTKPDK